MNKLVISVVGIVSAIVVIILVICDGRADRSVWEPIPEAEQISSNIWEPIPFGGGRTTLNPNSNGTSVPGPVAANLELAGEFNIVSDSLTSVDEYPEDIAQNIYWRNDHILVCNFSNILGGCGWNVELSGMSQDSETFLLKDVRDQKVLYITSSESAYYRDCQVMWANIPDGIESAEIVSTGHLRFELDYKICDRQFVVSEDEELILTIDAFDALVSIITGQRRNSVSVLTLVGHEQDI